MFLKFESAKKNEKEENIPLTRNNSLYNQTPRGDNKYPPPARTVHTPPLIVKTPENMGLLRIPIDRDESDIAFLNRSPSRRQTGGVSTRSTARDTTDGRAPYRPKKSSKPEEELLQNKRTNIDLHYRRQSYKSPAPIDEARKLAKSKQHQKPEGEETEGAASGGDGAGLQGESRPTSMGMLDSDANSSDGETTTRRKKAYLKSKELITYFAQLARSKNPNDAIDLQKVERLIRNGADINVNDKYGQTVLHEVAKNWHIDIAKYLIKKGASFTVQDRYGRTPLHLASAVGHVEMIDFLVGKDTGIFSII